MASNGFQLLDRCRSVNVGRNKQGAPLLLLQKAAQFTAGGGFAGPLKADHHQGHRRFGRKIEGIVLTAAHHGDQFVVNNPDNLLAGGQALENFRSNRLDTDIFDEVLDDLEVDVSFQERQAHFTQGVLDVLLGHDPLAAEFFKDRFKFFGKAVEHRGCVIPVVLNIPKGDNYKVSAGGLSRTN